LSAETERAAPVERRLPVIGPTGLQKESTMKFDKPAHAMNQSLSLAVHEALKRMEEGLKKEIARAHLLSADWAERGGDEVTWILELDRAARVLEQGRPAAER
jgi:hypothetical protein